MCQNLKKNLEWQNLKEVSLRESMVKPFIFGNTYRRGCRPPIINADIQYLVYGEDEKKHFEHVRPHGHPSTKIAD